MNVRSDLALLALAVVGVLSDLACVLTGHTAPSLFEQVTLVGVAGAAGVALPPALGGSSDPAPAATPAQATYQAAPTAAPTVPQSAAGAVPAPYDGPVGL